MHRPFPTACILAALTAASFPAPTARGSLIAYESFADPAGTTLVNSGGGTGFTGTWQPGGFNATVNSNYQVAAGSLGYGTLVTAGNQVTTAAQAAIAGVSRNLATALGVAGTTRYLSVELQPQGTLNGGAFNGFFGLYLNASTTTPAVSQDLYLGKPGAGAVFPYVLEDRGGTNQHASNFVPVPGRADLLVLRADFTAGTDAFTLYVNPPVGGPEPASGTLKQDSDVGTVSALTIYSTGAFAIDEIRIGTTYADVVPTPEPAAAGLFALALPLAARRRRRLTSGRGVQRLGEVGGVGGVRQP